MDEEDILCELCCERDGGLNAWQQADEKARALLSRHRDERPKCRIEKFCPVCILRCVQTWEEDPSRQPEKSGCDRNGVCCPLCRFELRKPCLESEIARASKRFQLDAAQFQTAFLMVDSAHRTNKKSAMRMLQTLIEAIERRKDFITAVSQEEPSWLQKANNQLEQDLQTIGVMIKMAP